MERDTDLPAAGQVGSASYEDHSKSNWLAAALSHGITAINFFFVSVIMVCCDCPKDFTISNH